MGTKTLTFASLQVARTRSGGTSIGGRYNPKTRRFVIPASFAGKKVAVVTSGELLLVGGAGDYACHPSQHFVTLPAGLVTASTSITLEAVAKLPEKVGGVKLPAGTVGYRLPKVAKKTAKKTAPADKPAEAPADKPAEA
jgi:hypothetical protein